MKLEQLEVRNNCSSYAFSAGLLYQLDANSIIERQLKVFPNYQGSANISAFGDQIAIGVKDGPPHIKVLCLQDLSESASFFAYSPDFLGGVNLDLNKNEIVAGTNAGAPHLKTFTLYNEGVVETSSVFVGDPNYQGGVTVSYSPQPSFSYNSNELARKALYVGFRDDISNHERLEILNGVDYYLRQFGVNTTTNFLANNGLDITSIFVGNKPQGLSSEALGVSDPSSYFKKNEYLTNLGYVFYDELGGNSIKVANAIVHEFIHNQGVFSHSIDQQSVFSPFIKPYFTYIDDLTARLVRAYL